jgi:CBS domain-containing protein
VIAVKKSGERTMWRNDRERPDDPQTRDRETERLSRDEYERPLYGPPPRTDEPRHHGSRPQQNQGVRYDRATWSFATQSALGARFRSDPRERPPQPPQPIREARPQPTPQQAQPAASGAALRTLQHLRAHELMTRRVATVHPASSIERAARLMEECDCGALPVVGDNGVLVGMLSDRDITLRIVARGRDVRSAIVADCMTQHVYACYATESVAECMRQMAHHQVRRMPIVDERGRLVGIVSQSDLARHARDRGLPDERHAVAQVVGDVSLPQQGYRR